MRRGKEGSQNGNSFGYFKDSLLGSKIIEKNLRMLSINVLISQMDKKYLEAMLAGTFSSNFRSL